MKLANEYQNRVLTIMEEDLNREKLSLEFKKISQVDYIRLKIFINLSSLMKNVTSNKDDMKVLPSFFKFYL